VDFWWISGGIDTCSKNVRDPKFLTFLMDSWWIPGGIDTFSKYVRDPKLPRNS
jgi:hypothetical protein